MYKNEHVSSKRYLLHKDSSGANIKKKEEVMKRENFQDNHYLNKKKIEGWYKPRQQGEKNMTDQKGMAVEKGRG